MQTRDEFNRASATLARFETTLARVARHFKAGGNRYTKATLAISMAFAPLAAYAGTPALKGLHGQLASAVHTLEQAPCLADAQQAYRDIMVIMPDLHHDIWKLMDPSLKGEPTSDNLSQSYSQILQLIGLG